MLMFLLPIYNHKTIINLQVPYHYTLQCLAAVFEAVTAKHWTAELSLPSTGFQTCL